MRCPVWAVVDLLGGSTTTDEVQILKQISDKSPYQFHARLKDFAKVYRSEDRAAEGRKGDRG
ncbi:hypothetical protein GCM10022251_79830 [Phytohabitans flavus]|uniref:Uncharacterized protein n=1 Tax=Phytohabitans flavus TaxID=1076124 RepID=A0A6F8Y447_9ACTN|nr:hypothetical protein Pflav_072960 [Phytohabitans flavus]